MAQSTLVIRRDSEQDIKMRELEVFVDGEFAASVEFGRSFEIGLAPGEHSVMVSNKLKKEKAQFTSRDGETVIFEGANVLTKGVSMLLAGLGMFVYHVTLKRIQ